MKLILGVEALTPGLSGIGRYTWELAQRLPAHADVSKLQFYKNRHWVVNPASLVNAQTGRTNTPDLFSRIGKKILNKRWVANVVLPFSFKGNVFHGPNFFLPPYADVGVITVHDLSVFKFPQTHPAQRVAQFEHDFARSVQKASQVITDCETTRLEVMAYTGLPADRITAVPLGVSPHFKPRNADVLTPMLHGYGLQPGAYLLCVSTLEPRKKISQLLAAYRTLDVVLQRRYPLVLAGAAGWLNDRLLAEIAAGQQQGWLLHLGFVPEHDLPYLYAGAASFCYPSIYEGFGLPPIEAMACGVPTVVANTSCLPEITQGAALLANPDDTISLGQALAKSLLDEQWRGIAVAHGLKVAASYTWDNCVNRTVAVYEKALTAST